MNPAIKSALLRCGIFSAHRTQPQDLLKLITCLRPQYCEKELRRIGAAGDGGYLIPDDLEGIEYCFSPGVSTVATFEEQLADLGIKSFLADYSVDGPPVSRTEFCFDKKYLGASEREPYITLTAWKDKYLKDYTRDLLLEMDIEGAEYEVIFNMPDALLKQFRIMVVEFHYLDRLFEPAAFSLFASCFYKILEHFYVVHIHPNNVGGSCKADGIEIPKFMEFTFYNKQRVNSAIPVTSFPHKLDADNTSAQPMPLPKCWYAST